MIVKLYKVVYQIEMNIWIIKFGNYREQDAKTEKVRSVIVALPLFNPKAKLLTEKESLLLLKPCMAKN